MSYNWDFEDILAYNNEIGKYKFRREYKFIQKHIDINCDNVLDIGGGLVGLPCHYLKLLKNTL